ncbi:MAG: class I tRNA ligase family protein [Ardenticatenales bacterium]|nr:class I tRNA ligase family protein [Ardenticatenales bacterium]
MGFNDVSNKPDFVQLERDILALWEEKGSFEKLRELRAKSETQWSFVDGPITANNPMGVHHAWGRTYKDLFNRYQAMLGNKLRWQQGFDCQGLWVEVNVEQALGFDSKKQILDYGVERFTNDCKARVLQFSAKQTEQSVRLGYWMDWNDTDTLLALREKLLEDPMQEVTIQGPKGPVTGSVTELVGKLGSPEVGGSYFTFSDENNYTIWALLKKLWGEGKLYRGTDVVPWGAKSGTSYSQMEVIDGRQLVAHRAIFVRFPLLDRENEYLLVWTTTPWTLVVNTMAAVNVDLNYVKLQAADGAIYYFAEENLKYQRLDRAFKTGQGWIEGVPRLKTLEQIFKERGGYEILEVVKGADLVGLAYTGPYDEMAPNQMPGGFPIANESAKADGRTNAASHRVVDGGRDSDGSEIVVAGEGTGIVHMAPGAGDIDHKIGKKYDMPLVAPLDEEARFWPEFGWLAGKQASEYDTKTEIIDDLKERGFLVHVEQYPHVYPHCWRSGEELVFRLVDEWYINMDWRQKIKDIVADINWFPSWGEDREQDWLDNMGDWMISKKRVYGLALPIWEFPDGTIWVVGSKEELQELAVEGWDEFAGHSPHRPWIDAVKIRHPESGLVGTRIPDVGNPWLDAGIVPYSTLRYNTDRAYWEQWFPADWVSESFPGQFRNWFYSLLAQSAAFTGRKPFKNLFSYGLLLAEDGREMHKSWGNAIWFDDAAEVMGADTMRWLYAAANPEKNLRFGYGIGDEVRRRVIIPLWNVYSFLVTYARADGWTPVALADVAPSPNGANAQLDKWILERLHETTLATRKALDGYDAQLATVGLEEMLDDLSNWYVRRSRRRFWRTEADVDKQAAYATLYHVLVEFIKLLAPFIPFTTEAMYQNLVCAVDPAAPESVHHHLYPAPAGTLDRPLLDKMRTAITVAKLGRSARSSVDMKLRQPLAAASVFVGSAQARADLEELADVLQEEINVKELRVVSEVGELVDYRLLPNSRALGPKFGKDFPKVRQALTELDAATAAQTLQDSGELTLTVNGAAVTLTADDVLVQTESRGDLAVASEKGVTVAVDTNLSDELLQEGYARDLVRFLNNMRKEADLDISDRIEVVYEADGLAAETVANFSDYIAGETLAVSLVNGATQNEPLRETTKLGDNEVTIAIRKLND